MPQRKTPPKRRNFAQKAGHFMARYWFVAFAVVFYLFFAAYYMGPSFTHCTDRLYGLGDSTAGPVWENGLKPSMPLVGGYETATNYPVGENLFAPVKYSAVGQIVALKVTSKIVGPVCGYNVFNVMGYLSTALMMCAFIYYLTKNRWIGLLAGYAVAYTPYAQSKVGGHPSYGFASLLIAVLWLGLHTIKRRRLKYGVLLAIMLAVCMYFDPYFVLLSGTIIGPLIAVWVLYALFTFKSSKQGRAEIVQTLKVLGISFGIFLGLLTPLIYIRIHDSKAINATASATRGDVVAAAQQCSNVPLDYLLPDPRNQVLAEKIPNYTQRNILHRHWCGFGESRVSLSLTILGTITLGLIILCWEKLNRRRVWFRENLRYDPRLLVGAVAVIGFAALALSLPPHLHGLIMPSRVVLKFTNMWRIFAREYLVVNLAAVVLFAIVLKYFSTVKLWGYKYIRPALYIIFFVAILFEYQINTPFLPLTFSFSQDTPSIYKQIRDDNNINAIAEFPNDRIGIEYDSVVYYLTMQNVHKKKIYNSATPTDVRDAIHIATRDITDPQTLPALRAMGIRYIVVHDVSEDELISKTNGTIQIIGESTPQIYGLTMVRPGKTNAMYLAKISDGPKTDNILTIQKGYAVNLPLQQNPLNVEYEVVQDAELKIVPLGSTQNSDLIPACFQVKMSAAGDAGDLTISVNGKPVQTLGIYDNYTTVRILAKEYETITLHNSNGYNMRLNNLGCAN